MSDRPFAAGVVQVRVDPRHLGANICPSARERQGPRQRKEDIVTTRTSTPIFYPGLLYRDADAGMKWLEHVLGCERREDHRDEDGNVVHAELVFRGAIVMLSSAGVGREPLDRKSVV
jgi:hypothetical protein